MSRPSNTRERRAQITRALIQVMARRGYDGASIAHIAEAAGLTPGLVHYHFKSKQEILLSALELLVERHEQRLERRLKSASGDPIRELEVFIDFHLGLGKDADPEALACWVLLGGEALREPRVGAALEEALEGMTARLADTIARGVTEGAFACEAPRAAASALIAVMQGYFVLAATARALIPRGSAAPSARQMAEGLLHPARRLTSASDDR